MSLATITTKGQITIPKNIRDSLRLTTGDKIEIVMTSKREALIRPISKKVDDIFCKLHNINQKSISIEAMNDAIKNRMKDKFK
ncbi:AbrB/MazE/SpoVT family DNA-binding domain-containing protein [Desulfobacter latus]|uniref:AbrB/MazE/SpoVT family DNA-binding domain-containing protein n=1 Tax=Desulfobacter latus TaxID=2292 RepID=A0A850T6J5_9BACT|nr:AbrB/MazE/SpoVT family DNA-binding domain-containing protein [Desulfobacter latus]NWH06721.1 AbrB/MazE/SpoVT family DNA-binding domain-containing protein [Desulfobacter latus]